MGIQISIAIVTLGNHGEHTTSNTYMIGIVIGDRGERMQKPRLERAFSALDRNPVHDFQHKVLERKLGEERFIFYFCILHILRIVPFSFFLTHTVTTNKQHT